MPFLHHKTVCNNPLPQLANHDGDDYTPSWEIRIDNVEKKELERGDQSFCSRGETSRRDSEFSTTRSSFPRYTLGSKLQSGDSSRFHGGIRGDLLLDWVSSRGGNSRIQEGSGRSQGCVGGNKISRACRVMVAKQNQSHPCSCKQRTNPFMGQAEEEIAGHIPSPQL
ncbi:unnamed protein product [Arabidopsis halleri]